MSLPSPAPAAFYRADPIGEAGLARAAGADLDAARDALHLALSILAGEGEGERTQEALLAESAQARACLAEAVVALGRARVFIPGIHTHTLAVVMASEADPSREAARLYQLTTRLLWHNHTRLPVRRLAAPLGPEDEAQLARVVAGLARHARIDRLLRYGWLPVLLVVGALGPFYAVPLFGPVVALLVALLAAWQLRSEGRSPVVVGP